jgi:4-hydroxyacetophenone monooxygenase
LYWSYGDTLLETLRVDPRWPDQSRSVNAANGRIRRAYEDNLKTALGGRPDLLAKVIPDYPVFAKRMLIDNHWCRMLQHRHVDLVTSGVRRVRGNSLEDAGGVCRDADVIVYATGFNALRFLWPMRVTGAAGATLEQIWGNDARAYLGMATPGFPNLFLLYGPNTNLAHGGSIYFHAECQARYIAQCLIGMIERNCGAMEVTDVAHRRYCASVDAEHASLIWANAQVGEWFKNDAGRVVCVSPWSMVDYWHMTHTPEWGDFRLEP